MKVTQKVVKQIALKPDTLKNNYGKQIYILKGWHANEAKFISKMAKFTHQ